MIAEVARLLSERMKPYGVEVVFGKPRFEQSIVADNRINMRDLGADTWGPPNVAGDKDRPFWCRWVGVEVLFEIASTKGGASELDHKRACADIAEQFACQLLIVSQSKKQEIRGHAMSGQFIEDPETPQESGARYVLTFSMGKSVTKTVAVTGSGYVPAGTVTTNGEQQSPAES